MYSEQTEFFTLQIFDLPPEDPAPYKFQMLNPKHMQALIWKNFLWMWRNVG